MMATYTTKLSLEGTPQSSSDQLDWGFSLFNGDFPLILHASKEEASLYTGSPYFFPLFVSLGSTNQVGYMDAYRMSTPLAILSLGYRYNLFSSKDFSQEGLFATWGWRHGVLSGGFAWQPYEHTLQGHAGASFEQWAVSVHASSENIGATMTFRTENSWSVGTSVEWDFDGSLSISVGAGISRKDYPAHSLYDEQWDMLIAHRGSLLNAPENSIPAFDWALSQPQYVGIETDIRQTADGSFVLVHDSSLARYEHGLTKVSELTRTQIKSLDMGTWFDPRFSGEKVLELAELARFSNANPSTYWLLEIKDTDWTEDDVYRFLSIIDATFTYPQRVVFYVVSHDMLPLLKSITGRPVGLQLDTVKSMLYLSDHLLPLVDEEIDDHLKEADFFTILSSKYDRQQEIEELAELFDIPVMFWNFHDTIFGYIPKTRKQFPLGMPTIEHGPTIRKDYIPGKAD